MALIDDPSTWFNGVTVNGALLKTKLTDPVNILADSATKNAGTNSGSDAGTITLTASPSGVYAPLVAFYVVTATEQRHYRVRVMASIAPATTASGAYRVRTAYNSGGSLAVPIPFGVNASVNSDAGVTDLISQWSEGDIVLPAGTYRFYPIATRVRGGDAADALQGPCYITIDDIGAA